MESNNLYFCYYLDAKCAVSELSTSSYCDIPETDDEGTVVRKYLRFEKTKEFIGIVFVFAAFVKSAATLYVPRIVENIVAVMSWILSVVMLLS